MNGIEALAAFAQAKLRLPHKPWPKQRRFIELNCLEALYGGAAGGGKSDALLVDALKYAHVPGYSAILFRKTYTDLSLPDAIMNRAHEWLAGTGARWIDRDKTYQLPTSGRPATLTFGYLDGPRDRFRYQGAMVQYCGFDELTQFPERDYKYLFSRLRRLKELDVPLRMRGATNPGDIGHEWVGSRFGIIDGYDPDTVLAGPDGRMFVPARLEDNPALGEDYERALRELDEVTYQQLRHGRWIVDASDLVYSLNEQKNIIDELPKLAWGEHWTYILAADFGVTDPTAFAVWAFTEHDPYTYLVESEEWVGMYPSESAEMAKEWERRYSGFERIVGDIGGLGKGFAEEWRRRFTLPIEPAEKPNKLGYIKLMNGEMQHGRIKIVRATNAGYIACVRQLRWKDEKHQAEHPGLPNHLSDAGLYGWRECRAWDWSERGPQYERGTAEWQQLREDQRQARVLDEYREEQENEGREWDQGNDWIRSSS